MTEEATGLAPWYVTYEISAKHDLDLHILRENVKAAETLRQEEELKARELAELKRLQEKYL